MIREDKGEEGASTVDVGAIWLTTSDYELLNLPSILTRYDGSAHWVVATDADTEEDTGDKNPNEDLVAGEVAGNRDADDGGDDDENELLSVHKTATKLISEETE